MRKSFFSLFFGVLFSIPVLGCLNGESLRLENGAVLYEDYEGYVPYGHQFRDNEELKHILASLGKNYKETGKKRLTCIKKLNSFSPTDILPPQI